MQTGSDHHENLDLVLHEHRSRNNTAVALTNVDFVGDIALASNNIQDDIARKHMLEEEVRQIELHINTTKIEVSMSKTK